MVSRVLPIGLALALVLGCSDDDTRSGSTTADGGSAAAGAGGSAGGGATGGDAPGGGGGAPTGLPRLRVAPDDRHVLETEQGEDFFWLGNMPWLPEQISMADMALYLDARQAQGHTVISIVAHNWESPLYNDEVPFSQHGPVVLNEAYWSFIDWIVDEAAARHLYVALAALWGFDADSMFDDPYQHNYDYGRLLGERYGDRTNIVFVAAGEFQTIKCPTRDYCPNEDEITDEERTLLERIADGFRAGAAAGDPDGDILITLHGMPQVPAYWAGATFHEDDWVDFYLEQSWQFVDVIDDIFSFDWGLASPVKPAVQGETGWWERSDNPEVPHDAWVQRYQGYWSVFHGACGHTYGSFFWENLPGDFSLPGAQQMAHLKRLILSKPMKGRVPDQSVITADTLGSDYAGPAYNWDAELPDLRCATRAADRSWALVYSTQGQDIGIEASALADGTARAYWYDPRNGRWHDGQNETATKTPFLTDIPTGSGAGVVTFDPPGSPGVDADWVLEVDVD